MIQKTIKAWRRFRGDENGSVMLIEFAILSPLLFGCLIMSVEMSFFAIRHMLLDRGLDMTVRFVRLNTNTPMSHQTIKDKICETAGFLQDCEETLRLEMIRVDPRDFAAFDQSPDCVDTSIDPRPVRGWNLGIEHQLMLLRACYQFEPFFPTTGLGYALEKDGAGRASMVSSAAFVQEPN
ncbi:MULTISPECIES: TadE/TadG family type IV pilus assembly protein [Sulfitobacter]|jgi:hypothetical protein|uniref:TadE-like protein n=1 Tax=Sulfitobacter dubius TaxID=218673 RepID=A0ABY3ZLM1_9RHOB|nr:hypothetical protein [Sulfitobacter dubius]UOA15387.1 hypothetical protein DSM109990_02219 [Sulfitobacter dubius]WOI29190.1 pilus assembly protein [Sulfitobacter dubius]SFG19334.1 hypothetical protein SAMN04488039_10158 [Sulfitobacter dubius]